MSINNRFSAYVALSLFSLVSPASLLSAAEPASGASSPAEAIAQFQAGWQEHTGYMRPANDNGWKVRMRAFQTLVHHGRASAAPLVELLDADREADRVFAAQALAFLAEPSSREALEEALDASHPAVRMYAIDALSMLGRMDETAELRSLRDDDPNRDVRSHVRFALERDEEPQPKAIGEQLIGYDLSKLGSARFGEPAPDFELADPLGNRYRLSDFRGEKAVVLVFVYGDT